MALSSSKGRGTSIAEKGGHNHTSEKFSWHLILLVAVSASAFLLFVTPTVIFTVRKSNSKLDERSGCWVPIYTRRCSCVALTHTALSWI